MLDLFFFLIQTEGSSLDPRYDVGAEIHAHSLSLCSYKIHFMAIGPFGYRLNSFNVSSKLWSLQLGPYLL